MIFKNKRAETRPLFTLLSIVAIVAVVGLVSLFLFSGGITGNATASPGLGVAKTQNIDLANACNVKLYGAGVQLAKPGAKSAIVDDAALNCVQSSGGSGTGGTCLDGEDGCSNTFSLNSDPDADPVEVSFDVLDSSGAVIGDMFVTQSGQVLGSGVGGPGEDIVCAKYQVVGCKNLGLTGCGLGNCIQQSVLGNCVGLYPRSRLCPEPPIIISP